MKNKKHTPLFHIFHKAAVIFLIIESIYVLFTRTTGAAALMTYLVTAGAVLSLAGTGKRHTERLRHAVRFLMNLFMAAYLIFLTVLGISARVFPPGGDERVMIVLGAALENDRPCMVLRMRLDKAAAYAGKDGKILIITSGGTDSDSTLSEGQAMKAYLEEKGIEGSRIVSEDEATDTEENLLYSLAIMKDLGMDEDTPVIIVTNGFHALRARFYAGMAGFTDVRLLAAGMPAADYVPDTLREILGYGKLILRYLDVIELRPSPYGT